MIHVRVSRHPKILRPSPYVLAVAAASWLLYASGASVSADQSGTLTGQVVDAESGVAIPGAQVTLLIRAEGQRTSDRQVIETDATGRFTINVGVRTGRLAVLVQAPGYSPGYPGQLGPADVYAAGGDLSVAAGLASGVRVRLWKQGLIHGIVRDSAGKPVVGAEVSALVRSYTGVGWRWIAAKARVATSDDTGAYRISELATGAYVVAVRTRERGMTTYAPGEAALSGAMQIAMAPGMQWPADVTIDNSRSRGRIVGRVVAANGGPATGVPVKVGPLDPEGDVSVPTERATMSGADGTFVFDGLASGLYRVWASVFPGGGEALFAVSGDFNRAITFYGPKPGAELPPLPSTPTMADAVVVAVSDARPEQSATLSLRPAGEIRGRVIFDGANAPALEKLRTIPVEVRPADGQDVGLLPQARIESDGTFRTAGLPDGRYVLRVNPTAAGFAGWAMVSIRASGVETLGSYLTVGQGGLSNVVATLTTKTTAIQGSVATVPGRQSEVERVIVFPQKPDERRHYLVFPEARRVRQVFVDENRRFQVQVPPGDYFVAPVPVVLPEHWMEPGFLQKLVASSTGVSVAVGETKGVVVSGN